MRAWGEMCKVVVQLVLLYSRKSWVVTREMLKVLTAFRYRAAPRIAGMTENAGHVESGSTQK